MSSLLVESPGLQTTVQDLGRPGYGTIGVSPSGAADAVSLQIANLLVGNEAGAAALELTLTGGAYSFPEGAVIALAGSDFGATLDGRALETGIAHAVQPGKTLVLGSTRSGARGYLSVAGGVLVEKLLGSASTHLLSGLGGFGGRALRKGDILAIGQPGRNLRRRKLAQKALQALRPRKVLRVTEGPQYELFSNDARRRLCAGHFTVSEESNRMGLRLEGEALASKSSGEMITEGVSLGAIQVTPSGQAIILFVEQQTAGGYPKIANVIGADLYCIGQLRPRDEIRFELVTLEAARALWMEQRQLLSSEELLFL